MDGSYCSTAAASATSCGTSFCDMMLARYGWKIGKCIPNQQFSTEDWKERKEGEQMRRSHNCGWLQQQPIMPAVNWLG